MTRYDAYLRSGWRDASATDETVEQLRAPGKVTLTMRLGASRGAPAAPAAPVVQRKLDDGGRVSPEAADQLERAGGGGGAPLPGGLRDSLEGVFGVALDAVRVHTGDASGDAARAIGARAYAQGQDIHFAPGQYDPGSTTGQHLIAHEVAHTVQQRGGSATRAKFEVGDPDDALEREADRAADLFVALGGGHPIAPIGLTSSSADGPLRRGPDDPPATGSQAKVPAEIVLAEIPVGKSGKLYGKLLLSSQSGRAGRAKPGGKVDPKILEAKVKQKLSLAGPAIERKLASLKGQRTIVTVAGVPLDVGVKLELGKLARGIDPSKLDSWKLELASFTVYVGGDVTRWLGDDGAGLHVLFEGGIKFTIGPSLQKAIETYVRESVRREVQEHAAKKSAEAIARGTKALEELGTEAKSLRQSVEKMRHLADPAQGERAIKKGMRGRARRRALRELRREVGKLDDKAVAELRSRIAKAEARLAEIAEHQAKGAKALKELRTAHRGIRKAAAKAAAKASSAMGVISKSRVGRAMRPAVTWLAKKAGSLAVRAIPVVGWVLTAVDVIQLVWGLVSFFKKLADGDLGGLGGGGGGKKPKNPGDGTSGGEPADDDDDGPRTTEPDRGGPATDQPDKDGPDRGGPDGGDKDGPDGGDKDGPDGGDKDGPHGGDKDGPDKPDSGHPPGDDKRPDYKEAKGKREVVATVVGGKLRVRVADHVTGAARAALIANLESGAFRYAVPSTDGKRQDVFGGKPVEKTVAGGHTWYVFERQDHAAPADKPTRPPVDPTKPAPAPEAPGTDGPGTKSDPGYDKRPVDPDAELHKHIVGGKLQVEIGAKVTAERRAALVAELTGGSFKARFKKDGKVEVYGGKPEVVTAGGKTIYRFARIETVEPKPDPKPGSDGEPPPAAPDGDQASPVEVKLRKGKAWVSIVTKDPALAKETEAELRAGRYTHRARVKGKPRRWSGKPRIVKQGGRTWYVLSRDRAGEQIDEVRDALEDGMKPLRDADKRDDQADPSSRPRQIAIVTVKTGDTAGAIMVRALRRHFRIGAARAWQLHDQLKLHFDKVPLVGDEEHPISPDEIGKHVGKKIRVGLSRALIAEIKARLKKSKK